MSEVLLRVGFPRDAWPMVNECGLSGAVRCPHPGIQVELFRAVMLHLRAPYKVFTFELLELLEVLHSSLQSFRCNWSNHFWWYLCRVNKAIMDTH